MLRLSAEKKRYKFQNFSIKIKFEKGAKIRIRNSLQHLLELLLLERNGDEWEYELPELPFIKKTKDGRYRASNPIIFGSYPFAKGFDAGIDEKIHIDDEVVMEMTYYGCGDIDEVKKLLERLEYIGEDLGKGYGKVKEIIIEEIDKDLSLSCKAQNDEDRMFELMDEDVMGQCPSGRTGRVVINELKM